MSRRNISHKEEINPSATVIFFDADKKPYPTPEDDPDCKYNGTYVVSDCYCKYKQYYDDNAEKYKLNRDQLKRYNAYCLSKVTDFGKDTKCQGRTPDNLTADCYCKYPTAYQNQFFGLSQRQIDRLNNQCASINRQQRNSLRPPSLKQEIISNVKGVFSWNIFKEKMNLLAQGFVQPESLAFMGGMFLADKLLPWLAGLLGKLLTQFLTELSEIIVPVLSELAVGASEAFLAVIPEFLADAIIAAASAASTAAAETLTLFSSIMDIELTTIEIPGLDAVTTAILALYGEFVMTGMLIDLFTESELYGYDKMVNGEFLVNLSQRMNDLFMKVVIQNINLPEGENWPLEYLADHLVFSVQLDDATKVKYQSMQFDYIFQYLSNLTYNSRGEFIYPIDVSGITKDEYTRIISQIPIKEGFSATINGLLYLYSNDNTTAVIFLKRNWLIVLIIILAIVIVIIFLK